MTGYCEKCMAELSEEDIEIGDDQCQNCQNAAKYNRCIKCGHDLADGEDYMCVSCSTWIEELDGAF